MILAVYGFMFLILGVGVMIAIKAQTEYEADTTEPEEIPDTIQIKRHRATGWRYW